MHPAFQKLVEILQSQPQLTIQIECQYQGTKVFTFWQEDEGEPWQLGDGEDNTINLEDAKDVEIVDNSIRFNYDGYEHTLRVYLPALVVKGIFI